MKASELIAKLSTLVAQEGDLEVLITDGFQAGCYRGSYEVVIFEDLDDTRYIDIGIGGCLEG